MKKSVTLLDHQQHNPNYHSIDQKGEDVIGRASLDANKIETKCVTTANCELFSPSYNYVLHPDDSQLKSTKDMTRTGQQETKSEIDGRQAWLTLVCIFIVNACTLGSLKVYALIFEEIVSQNYYNREDASWPISTASTIQNLAGLLTPLLCLKFSWRSIEMMQTFLFVIANIGAYFSNSLSVDILCLGFIQGIALSIRYNMNVVINNEYFSKYRATAMGVSLAGSTCGVFFLKPIIAYALDYSNRQFRYAYFALAVIMSTNLVLNFFIRKPRILQKSAPLNEQDSLCKNEDKDPEFKISDLRKSMINLVKNPNIHCIWIMQTLYFYISRTYTIFVVDYGVDQGFSRDTSRDFLDFWVYGEIGGRLLLGGLVDSQFMTLKWNIVVVSLILGLSGFAPLMGPLIFQTADPSNAYMAYKFWYFGLSFSMVAALSSLMNMMIIPFGQEYLGKRNVPWAFAIGSVVTSFFLLFRPSLIGLSRDYYKSYSLLITVMSTGPSIYAILFALLEPLLRRYKDYKTVSNQVVTTYS